MNDSITNVMRVVQCVAIVAVGFLSALTTANAAEATLISPSGRQQVIVWKDKNSYLRGEELIQLNVHRSNPVLVAQMIVCIVPDGTRVLYSPGSSVGFAMREVLVFEGKDSGCKGVVPMEHLRIK
jgi:hypothetical protein